MFNKIKKILASYFQQYVVDKKTGIGFDNVKKDIPFKKEEPLSSSVVRVQDNPLKPYWKPFGNEYTEPILIKQFVAENRPFSPEQHKEIFNKHISLKSFLAGNKSEYLQKMWKDAMHVKNVLEPLASVGVSYTLDLTGGSVRDFVLNNQKNIKDLDFMLSIQTENIDNHKVKNVFTQEQLSLVDWDNTYEAEQKKVKLIELCFLTHKEKVKLYNHTETRNTKTGTTYAGDIFKKDRLIAVFKTDGLKTHYPIDILLTDFKKPDFIADFDFDICKASICFVNPFVKKAFPKDHTHLVSRFVADLEFWADVQNKTITYNTDERSTYQIDRSFDNHIGRIEKKYPEYRVNVAGNGENKSYLESLILDRSLSKKDENAPKRKIKI